MVFGPAGRLQSEGGRQTLPGHGEKPFILAHTESPTLGTPVTTVAVIVNHVFVMVFIQNIISHFNTSLLSEFSVISKNQNVT